MGWETSWSIMVISYDPHSTPKDTPFIMVYGTDTMIHFEIDAPTWQRSQFNEEENKEGLRCVGKLIDETQDIARIREFSAKKRVPRRYNSNVVPREVQEGGLVLRQVVVLARLGKLQPTWEGPCRIYQKLPYGGLQTWRAEHTTHPKGMKLN